MSEFLHVFTLPSAWMALLTLVFLEVVLGIDNVVFISITTARLPEKQQPRARAIGLLLAMLARIGLLFGVSLLVQLNKPLFGISLSWISGAVSWQAIIVFAGGLFLLWKSVTEVHHKLQPKRAHKARNACSARFWAIIAQIVVLDAIFSMDSVLTAVGMVSFNDFGYEGAMTVMILAIVVAVTVMLFFAGAVSRLIERYPTIQMLAVSFLLLIAVMLLMEGAHLSHLTLFGQQMPAIPRGYVYFAIAFSVMVELFNIRMGRKKA